MRFAHFAPRLAWMTVVLIVAPASAQQAQPLRTFAVGPIEIRLPAGWVATSMSDGGQSISDPATRVWELEVASERLSVAPHQPRPELVARMAERSRAALVSELRGTATIRDGEGGEKIVVHDFNTPGGDRLRRVRAWHRIAVRGDGYMIANFNFVVDRAVAERPDVAAVRELVERQALDAVLRP